MFNMDNENKNENNLSENQFIDNELSKASEGAQEETPVTESENSTQDGITDTQSNDHEITESNKEETLVTPNYTEPVVESVLEKPAKKKHNGKLIAIFVVLAVILAGSITAFANRNKLANTLAIMTKSSSEYYAYIEQKNLDTQIDTFTKYYGKSLDYYKDGLSTENNLTFTISPEFAMMMGLTEIKPISAQFESSTKKGLSNFSGALSYDNKALASLEMLFDMNTYDYYFKVPELSSAYLLMSIKNIMEAETIVDTEFDYTEYMNNISTLLDGGLLSEETLNIMLKKYSSDVYHNIKTVEIEKNAEVTASNITSSYHKIAVTMTDKDLYNIAMAVLEDAKADKDLVKILVALQVLAENEYNEAIETAINDLKANEATLTNEPMLSMILYVDGNGNIMGREFNAIDDSNTSFGYTTTKNGTDIGFDVWFKENDTNVFQITADGTTNKDGFTGDSVIAVNYYDEFYGETTATKLNVALENVKMENNYLDGKFTLTADALLGMEIVAEFKAADKQQDMNLKMMAGGVETMGFQLTSKEVPFKEVKMPSSDEQVFDMTNEMESYMGTADLEGFMTNIQNVLGEDFGPLFEGLLSGM